MQHGTRKRQRFDPLAPIAAATWLVVHNRYSQVIESTELPPRADLRAILTTERERRRADGWTVDDIPTLCAFFFCERAGVRVCIGISRRDPADDRRGVP